MPRKRKIRVEDAKAAKRKEEESGVEEDEACGETEMVDKERRKLLRDEKKAYEEAMREEHKRIRKSVIVPLTVPGKRFQTEKRVKRRKRSKKNKKNKKNKRNKRKKRNKRNNRRKKGEKREKRNNGENGRCKLPHIFGEYIRQVLVPTANEAESEAMLVLEVWLRMILASNRSASRREKQWLSAVRNIVDGSGLNLPVSEELAARIFSGTASREEIPRVTKDLCLSVMLLICTKGPVGSKHWRKGCLSGISLAFVLVKLPEEAYSHLFGDNNPVHTKRQSTRLQAKKALFRTLVSPQSSIWASRRELPGKNFLSYIGSRVCAGFNALLNVRLFNNLPNHLAVRFDLPFDVAKSEAENMINAMVSRLPYIPALPEPPERPSQVVDEYSEENSVLSASTSPDDNLSVSSSEEHQHKPEQGAVFSLSDLAASFWRRPVRVREAGEPVSAQQDEDSELGDAENESSNDNFEWSPPHNLLEEFNLLQFAWGEWDRSFSRIQNGGDDGSEEGSEEDSDEDSEDEEHQPRGTGMNCFPLLHYVCYVSSSMQQKRRQLLNQLESTPSRRAQIEIEEASNECSLLNNEELALHCSDACSETPVTYQALAESVYKKRERPNPHVQLRKAKLWSLFPHSKKAAKFVRLDKEGLISTWAKAKLWWKRNHVVNQAFSSWLNSFRKFQQKNLANLSIGDFFKAPPRRGDWELGSTIQTNGWELHFVFKKWVPKGKPIFKDLPKGQGVRVALHKYIKRCPALVSLLEIGERNWRTESVTEAPSVQAAAPVVVDEQRAIGNARLEAPVLPVEVLESASSCRCKKSRCLKRYCGCFAVGVPCGDRCTCQNCGNRAIAQVEPNEDGSAQPIDLVDSDDELMHPRPRPRGGTQPLSQGHGEQELVERAVPELGDPSPHNVGEDAQRVDEPRPLSPRSHGREQQQLIEDASDRLATANLGAKVCSCNGTCLGLNCPCFVEHSHCSNKCCCSCCANRLEDERDTTILLSALEAIPPVEGAQPPTCFCEEGDCVATSSCPCSASGVRCVEACRCATCQNRCRCNGCDSIPSHEFLLSSFVGIDPGHHNVMLAVSPLPPEERDGVFDWPRDEFGRPKMEERGMTLKEFNQKSGRWLVTKKLRRIQQGKTMNVHQIDNSETALPGARRVKHHSGQRSIARALRDAEKELSRHTLKTMDPWAFMTAVKVHQRLFRTFHKAFSEKELLKAKFNRKSRTQKTIDDLLNHVTWDRTKIAGLGHGTKVNGLRGCGPGPPIKRIRKHASKKRYPIFVVDENCTSLRSSCCEGAELRGAEQLVEKQFRVFDRAKSEETGQFHTKWVTITQRVISHSIRVCNSCGSRYLRDTSAAIQILRVLFEEVLLCQKRPWFLEYNLPSLDAIAVEPRGLASFDACWRRRFRHDQN